MNQPIALTSEDAAKLAKSATMTAEAHQQLAEAARIAAEVFGQFGKTAQQLELPEGPQE